MIIYMYWRIEEKTFTSHFHIAYTKYFHINSKESTSGLPVLHLKGDSYNCFT